MTLVSKFGIIWHDFWAVRWRCSCRIVCLAVVVAALVGIAPGQYCLAQEANIDSPAITLGGHAINFASALVPHRALKSIPSTFEVYQYDSSPLGGRAPLLLIHGLEGEEHPFFRWQQLAQYLSRDQAFQKRYKIYLARYNTRLSLENMTESFNLALRDLPRADRLTIVTVSMSGELVRNAMRDPAVDQSISRVLTMGAFFRGSPLFCQDWMSETIRKRHLSPPCRFYRSLGYKLYFDRHKTCCTIIAGTMLTERCRLSNFQNSERNLDWRLILRSEPSWSLLKGNPATQNL
jgi:hypothetical protein